MFWCISHPLLLSPILLIPMHCRPTAVIFQNHTVGTFNHLSVLHLGNNIVLQVAGSISYESISYIHIFNKTERWAKANSCRGQQFFKFQPPPVNSYKWRMVVSSVFFIWMLNISRADKNWQSIWQTHHPKKCISLQVSLSCNFKHAVLLTGVKSYSILKIHPLFL